MKVFPSVITSASSLTTYNWSSALDVMRHVKNGYFNLVWDIATSATTVSFAWSGCTKYDGTYVTGTPLIKSGATSGSGPAGIGEDNSSFSPEAYPWMKIGAKCTGTTSTLSCDLIVD